MFHSEIKSKSSEDICILIKPDNDPWSYLVDCGEASELTVKNCLNTKVIFISHAHIDHFVGFDWILRHQIGSKERVIICGPQGIAQQVQFKIKAYTWNLIEKGAITYEIREVLDEHDIKIYEIQPPMWELKEVGQIQNGRLFENERFNVDFCILDHKTPSLAFLFKERDSINISLEGTTYKGGEWVQRLKEAYEKDDKNVVIEIEGVHYKAEGLFSMIYKKEGDSVGIVMDHGPTHENHEKIKNLFFECKKVFIEAYYKNDDKTFSDKNFHSYAEASGYIMKEAYVQEAIPVHFSRKYQEDDIKILEQEFYQAYRED